MRKATKFKDRRLKRNKEPEDFELENIEEDIIQELTEITEVDTTKPKE